MTCVKAQQKKQGEAQREERGDIETRRQADETRRQEHQWQDRECSATSATSLWRQRNSLTRHVGEKCDTCGAKVEGAVGILNHIQVAHYLTFIVPSLQKPTPLPQRPTVLPQKPTPSLLPPRSSSATPQHTRNPLRSSSINWKGFLPEQFRKVIQEADQVWIAKCLYEPTGQLKQLKACWFHPPLEPKPSPPEPGWYYRQFRHLQEGQGGD